MNAKLSLSLCEEDRDRTVSENKMLRIVGPKINEKGMKKIIQ
jgi:hypothetical protein